MKDELGRVAASVKAFLEASDYCEQLAPDCLQQAALAYPRRGGKMLRPALVLWSCGLFAADRDRALPVAAAVELFHTWTLVHDDIIDQDDTRRGGPSAHRLVQDLVGDDSRAAQFGISQAILAGDVQQAWSTSLILQADGVPANIRLALAARMNDELTPQLISGEAMDVEFELRPFTDITVDEMEQMLRLKTAILLRYAAEAGAMIGLEITDRTDDRVTAIGDFAEAAGLAFQLRDDLLGMFGDEDKLGKPVGSDLRQGKRTYLFAQAMECLDADVRRRFQDLLGTADLTSAQIAEAAEILRAGGALAATEAKMQQYHATALTRLRQLPAGACRNLLQAWAEYTVNRDH